MECFCGQLGKYKCPKCTVRYCSVQCCKEHKGNCEFNGKKEVEVERIRKVNRNFLLEDEDDLVLDDGELSKLSKWYVGGNEKLREMLKNKILRKILTEVDKSENRLGALRSVMTMDKTGDSLLTSSLDEMLKSIGFLTEDGVSSL